MSESEVGQFEWQDRISPLQKGLLKLSSLLGFLIFFGGIQLSVRGNADLGGTLAGFGMFLAAQMRWGVKSLYNTLEARGSPWLETIGYANLFWLFFGLAFVLNSIGVVSILWMFTDFFTSGELSLPL